VPSVTKPMSQRVGLELVGWPSNIAWLLKSILMDKMDPSVQGAAVSAERARFRRNRLLRPVADLICEKSTTRLAQLRLLHGAES
jgi:hypothetical protein